jgi:hypothetical protein
MGTCKTRSRWSDRSIPDARHSVGPSGVSDTAALFGARVAEPILAAVMRDRIQQTGHMDASDPIEKSAHQGLASRGPSTYGSRTALRSDWRPHFMLPGKGQPPMLAPVRTRGAGPPLRQETPRLTMCFPHSRSAVILSLPIGRPSPCPSPCRGSPSSGSCWLPCRIFD